MARWHWSTDPEDGSSTLYMDGVLYTRISFKAPSTRRMRVHVSRILEVTREVLAKDATLLDQDIQALVVSTSDMLMRVTQ